MQQSLLVEHNGSATHLVLNRPDKANALDGEIVERMIQALDQARVSGVRLLTIRGAGKSLCSGFDLSALATESDGDLTQRFVRIEHMLQLVYHAPFQTIAFAHGRVFGAGADLFCACQQRVCASDATFRFPGVQFGIVLGTRRLGARVGSDAANGILLQGRTLDASGARAAGLVTAIAEPEEWNALAATHPHGDLDGETEQAVLNALTTDTRDADMAALAQSAARPGLKQRISEYRERMRNAARARQ